MLRICKRLALKIKKQIEFYFYLPVLRYFVVTRVYISPQRVYVLFTSTILTLEKSPSKTAKTPIKSGFSETISFLLSLDGGAGGNRTHVRKSLDMTFSGCSMSTEIPDRNLRHAGYPRRYSFCSWQSQRITDCSRWPLILCLGGAVALTAQTIRQRRRSLRCYEFAIISV